MAVQSQHRSISNFLNRNGQEGQDFSLQLKQGEFLDQSHCSHIFLNNGGSNWRKRARESRADHMNSHQLSLQPQSPQVIDLSLLNNQHYLRPPAPNIVSTGLRLSSNEEQAHSFISRIRQQQCRDENQNLVSSSSSGLLPALSEDFTAQIKRQREELDEFLHAQAEELRRTLAEKRQRHYSALLRAVEEPLARKLREKEAEVERATRRHEELEARAAQLTAEAQAWQDRARAHEAAAATLQTQLQQAMAVKNITEAAQDSVAGEEGLMCAGGGSGLQHGTEDAESAYVDPDRVTEAMTSLPPCKVCRRRAATMVVLPCWHLSLCPQCDRSALACPVCLTLRNSSVEAFLC